MSKNCELSKKPNSTVERMQTNLYLSCHFSAEIVPVIGFFCFEPRIYNNIDKEHTLYHLATFAHVFLNLFCLCYAFVICLKNVDVAFDNKADENHDHEYSEPKNTNFEKSEYTEILGNQDENTQLDN